MKIKTIVFIYFAYEFTNRFLINNFKIKIWNFGIDYFVLIYDFICESSLKFTLSYFEACTIVV